MSALGEQLSLEVEPTEEAVATPPVDAGTTLASTAEQAAASQARDRDVFLEAGAGTGKTRVLVDRYCDAVDLDAVEPERILAFTFTEKAAAEMRRRVRAELMRRSRAAGDRERAIRLQAAARAGEAAPITTIHGFCRRLLAAHPVAAGLDPRFRVLDAAEASRLAGIAFERALEGLAAADAAVARLAAGYRWRLGGLIRAAYQDCRDHGQRRPALPPLQITAFDGEEEPPEAAEVELVDAAYGALRKLLAAFGEELERLKAERSGVDFDDLGLLAVGLLQSSPAIASAYHERFDHLLVDELQDTSPLQISLLRHLQGPATRLFAVGDEFQSIYAFRGADLESFRCERDRAETSERAVVLPLSGSFRSTPDVVAAVNAVGSALLDGFNPLRVGRLSEAPPAGPPGPAIELLLTERRGWKEEGIELSSVATESEPNRIAEARALARRLRELADGGVRPGSMVLLLRAFTHVEAYTEALELAGLDPYVVGGRGYWSAQQVEDALRLLRCVANPLDDEALLGALASPACGASPDALWMLRRAAGKRRHMWPAIAAELLGAEAPAEADAGELDEAELERRELRRGWVERLPAADAERIGRFARGLSELRAEASLLPLDGLVERVLEAFDYDLVALALPGGARRAANLQKLIRIAAEYESHEGRDLRGFLAHAAARAALTDREAEAATAAEEHDGITVMTIHAAKGLEFDCVAVADLGRGHYSGAAPELMLAFDGAGPQRAGAAEAAGETDRLAPRVGLRLARSAGAALSVEGFKELSDAAARAEADESSRLVYVAASRARERLLLSGLHDPTDLDGERETRPSHSTLARLLPALGIGEELLGGAAGGPALVEVDPAAARADLEAGPFEPAPIAVRLTRAGPEAAAELAFDLRRPGAAPAPAPGGRPPMPALVELPASAARNLSYVGLADYSRCGYRFLVERVLGVGAAAAAAGPAAEMDGITPPVPRRSGLELGRAVHALLERAARGGWRPPEPDEVEATLRREGLAGDAADLELVTGMVSGWLGSPLLTELRDAGARFRAEVPFRVELEGTVLRGTIDLLAELAGRPPLVLDYKTDANPPAELPQPYELQRALYGLAVAAASDAERVETAYLFLHAPERPVRMTLGPGELASGRERIAAMIERIRAREFAVTESPHAALCHDCPARLRLCPYPPERTLAS